MSHRSPRRFNYCAVALALAFAAPLALAGQAAAEDGPKALGQPFSAAGSSIAIDGGLVYWIANGRILRADLATPTSATPLRYRGVQRIGAGTGDYAFTTLAQKGKSTKTFTRKLFLVRGADKPVKLARTVERLRSNLYCGAGIGLWGFAQGTLLYHTTTNKKKRKCTNNYTTTFFNREKGKKQSSRVFKTKEGLLGAQGNFVATKVRGKGGAVSVRATTLDPKKKQPPRGTLMAFPQKAGSTPLSASLGWNGSVVLTTEETIDGATRRNGYVASGQALPSTLVGSGEQWRYRACGHSIVRWLDEAVTGGAKAAIERVSNPFDPESEKTNKKLLPETPGRSVRALTCDAQRIAYVLAASKARGAQAQVYVDKVDTTGPEVEIKDYPRRTVESSVKISFDAKDAVSARDKISCTVKRNGADYKTLPPGANEVDVELDHRYTSVSVGCKDAVDNPGSSTTVNIEKRKRISFAEPMPGFTSSSKRPEFTIDGEPGTTIDIRIVSTSPSPPKEFVYEGVQLPVKNATPSDCLSVGANYAEARYSDDPGLPFAAVSFNVQNGATCF